MLPPELSVVVLFYRAEENARNIFFELVEALEKEGINYEIILVGNYDKNSDDATPDVLYELAKENPRIIVLAKEKKGMMGWDMRNGMELSNGEYIAVIDGDGQMSMEDVPICYNVAKAGNFDLVKTFRALRYDGMKRRLISACFNIIFRTLFCPLRKINDINSKPKVMTRAAYEQMHLKSNGWFVDAEIVIEALRCNMEIVEISTVFHKNEIRQSFIRVGAIFEFLYNLILYKLSYRKHKNK
jgi:glycosyltransferase involved in cell wall biosynthesis